MHQDTDAPLHEERITTVREGSNLHPSSSCVVSGEMRKQVTDGTRSSGFPVLVSMSVQEMVNVAQKIENTVLLVIREEPNLRLELYLRDVTDAVTQVLPVDEVSKSFLEMVKVAQKPENAAQLVIGLAFDSAMMDADHDALSCHWKHTARSRMRVMGDGLSRCR